MKKSLSHTNPKLQSLEEFINCVHPLFFSVCNGDTMEPLHSTAPNFDTLTALMNLDKTFVKSSVVEYLSQLSESDEDVSDLGKQIKNLHTPLIRTNNIGMAWVTDMEYPKDSAPLLHIMGPVFSDDFSLPIIENRLQQLPVSHEIKQHFLSVIHQLPAIPTQQLFQYAIMLHYSLTGEHIRTDQLLSITSADQEGKAPIANLTSRSSEYMLEQDLLNCVREGNLSYSSALERLSIYARPGTLSPGDYLRHIKNMLITFVTLCTRAAIEGGLSPDSALMISDHYIQKIEQSSSVTALGNVGRSMLEEFVTKVHRIQTQEISPAIQKICSYIQLHPEEKTNIHSMAQAMGYSDYYLSKKFKQEMGCSISEYANTKKMEKAKQLLEGTRMSVGQIAETLNLCSQSYFGKLFFQHTGMTPMDYRKGHRSENSQ